MVWDGRPDDHPQGRLGTLDRTGVRDHAHRQPCINLGKLNRNRPLEFQRFLPSVRWLYRRIYERVAAPGGMSARSFSINTELGQCRFTLTHNMHGKRTKSRLKLPRMLITFVSTNVEKN